MQTQITYDQLVRVYAPLVDAGVMLEGAAENSYNGQLAAKIERAKAELYPLIRECEGPL